MHALKGALPILKHQIVGPGDLTKPEVSFYSGILNTFILFMRILKRGPLRCPVLSKTLVL